MRREIWGTLTPLELKWAVEQDSREAAKYKGLPSLEPEQQKLPPYAPPKLRTARIVRGRQA